MINGLIIALGDCIWAEIAVRTWVGLHLAPTAFQNSSQPPFSRNVLPSESAPMPDAYYGATIYKRMLQSTSPARRINCGERDEAGWAT